MKTPKEVPKKTPKEVPEGVSSKRGRPISQIRLVANALGITMPTMRTYMAFENYPFSREDTNTDNFEAIRDWFEQNKKKRGRKTKGGSFGKSEDWFESLREQWI